MGLAINAAGDRLMTGRGRVLPRRGGSGEVLRAGSGRLPLMSRSTHSEHDRGSRRTTLEIHSFTQSGRGQLNEVHAGSRSQCAETYGHDHGERITEVSVLLSRVMSCEVPRLRREEPTLSNQLSPGTKERRRGSARPRAHNGLPPRHREFGSRKPACQQLSHFCLPTVSSLSWYHLPCGAEWNVTGPLGRSPWGNNVNVTG